MYTHSFCVCTILQVFCLIFSIGWTGFGYLLSVGQKKQQHMLFQSWLFDLHKTKRFKSIKKVDEGCNRVYCVWLLI